MITKNYELLNVVKFLPLSLMFNVIGGISVLFSKRSFDGILGVGLGIIWYLYTFPDTLRERVKVQKTRGVKDGEISNKIMVTTNIFKLLKIYFSGPKVSASLMKGN